MTITQYLVHRRSGEVLYSGPVQEEAEKRLVHQREIFLLSISPIEEGIEVLRKFYEHYDFDKGCAASVSQIYYTKVEVNFIGEFLR